MNLHQLKPNTERRIHRRVGRGGKKGTYSGKGTKGQKSRAGAGVKPGFRGGDNRLWQLFPKQRGASGKPGNNRPHAKHRYYQLRHDKVPVVNIGVFNRFSDGQRVNPELLIKEGIIAGAAKHVKVLGTGVLKKKVEFEGFSFSTSAKEKIGQSGSKIL